MISTLLMVLGVSCLLGYQHWRNTRKLLGANEKIKLLSEALVSPEEAKKITAIIPAASKKSWSLFAPKIIPLPVVIADKWIVNRKLNKNLCLKCNSTSLLRVSSCVQCECFDRDG